MWVKWVTLEGVQCLTVSANAWYGVVNRCKDGGSTKKRRHSYADCTMSDEFKDFQIFADWYVAQIGYGMKGYELDKDMLVKGNKLYSKETCVLIPSALNSFLTASKTNKVCATGVDRVRSGRYRAIASVGGISKYLGTYDTEDEARVAYLVGRNSAIRLWQDRINSGETVVDNRVIGALLNLIETT